MLMVRVWFTEPNCSIPERVTGIDLFYRLLHLSAVRGSPVYFLGEKMKSLKRSKNVYTIYSGSQA